jgi:hypothetical protein
MKENLMKRRNSWLRLAGRTSLLALLTAMGTGCDSLLGTDQAAFAAEARVLLEATSPVPLLLITSTNFAAGRDDDTGEIVTSLIASDTMVVSSADVDQTYDIFGANRFLVRVANPDDEETATIHLRVLLDGREVFNQRATMRDASLEYTAFHRN